MPPAAERSVPALPERSGPAPEPAADGRHEALAALPPASPAPLPAARAVGDLASAASLPRARPASQPGQTEAEVATSERPAGAVPAPRPMPADEPDALPPTGAGAPERPPVQPSAPGIAIADAVELSGWMAGGRPMGQPAETPVPHDASPDAPPAALVVSGGRLETETVAAFPESAATAAAMDPGEGDSVAPPLPAEVAIGRPAGAAPIPDDGAVPRATVGLDPPTTSAPVPAGPDVPPAAEPAPRAPNEAGASAPIRDDGPRRPAGDRGVRTIAATEAGLEAVAPGEPAPPPATPRPGGTVGFARALPSHGPQADRPPRSGVADPASRTVPVEHVSAPAPAEPKGLERPAAEVSAPAVPTSLPTPSPLRQIVDAVAGELPLAPPTASAGTAMPAGPGPLKILTLQLHPADLGHVLVRMRLQDGRLEMSLRTGREETAERLRREGGALADLLREAGYTPESVTIQAGGTEAPVGTPGNASGRGQADAFPASAQGGDQGGATPDQPGRRPSRERDEAASHTRDQDHETDSRGRDRGGLYL